MEKSKVLKNVKSKVSNESPRFRFTYFSKFLPTSPRFRLAYCSNFSTTSPRFRLSHFSTFSTRSPSFQRAYFSKFPTTSPRFRTLRTLELKLEKSKLSKAALVEHFDEKSKVSNLTHFSSLSCTSPRFNPFLREVQAFKGRTCRGWCRQEVDVEMSYVVLIYTPLSYTRPTLPSASSSEYKVSTPLVCVLLVCCLCATPTVIPSDPH